MASPTSDSPSSWRAIFVYYKVPADQAAQTRSRVVRAQAQLRQVFPGLSTRLMCRADASPGSETSTWMEVYEHAEGVREQVLAELDALLAEPAALPWPSPRHVEVFVSLGDHPAHDA